MKTLFEIEPAFATALRAAGLDSFDAIFNMPASGPPASKHLHRETVPVEIPIDGVPKKFFLKRVFWVPPKHSFWPLLRGKPNISQPRNEWNILAKLYSAGIPAMQRVAYGERRIAGRPTSGFILVEAIMMEHTIQNWLVPGFNDELEIATRQKTRLIYEVGRLIGKLQTHGFFWPDLHPKHIFGRLERNRWDLCIIDIERMRHCWSPAQNNQGPKLELGTIFQFRDQLSPLQLPYWHLCHFVSGFIRGYAGSVKKQVRNTFKWYGSLPEFFEYFLNRTRWNESIVPYRAQCFDAVEGMHVDRAYSDSLQILGLDSFDSIFNFNPPDSLSKPGLKKYRGRARFTMPNSLGKLKNYFLKRFDHPPISERARHILESNPKRSAAWRERHFIKRLGEIGIPTMRVVAYGEEMRGIIEKRSFLITEEVPGESLEKMAARPANGEQLPATFRERKDIIRQLALLVRTMHWQGFFHRDLYLSHVFLCSNPDGKPVLHLIDLARMIEKPWQTERWKFKDLAALEYSSPAPLITRSDRIRFLHTYLHPRLLHPPRSRSAHKRTLRYYVRPVLARARRMARHDARRKARHAIH